MIGSNRCRNTTRSYRNNSIGPTFSIATKIWMEEKMGRGILLWLLGVPIPVIILLWLFFGR